MALINKIRQKSGWAIGFVALGLGLFMVGSDLLRPNSSILGKNKTDVGEIAGDVINIKEYQDEIDQLKYNYTLNYGKNPTESEMNSIRQQAWDYLVVKIAFQDQYDKLGLQVTDDEQWDMVQGNNVNPDIKRAFTNPKTGQFDRSQVINYLKNIKQMPPAQQASWYLFERNLKPSRLRIKYDNMLVKASYATDAAAKMQYDEQNSVAEIKYLYIPYYSVSDSSINITDSDLKTYLNDHKAEYKINEETRSFSYISVPIIPSADDSAYFRQELSRIADEFKSTTEDSIFARANSDAQDYFGVYTIDQLPEILQKNYSNLSEGDVRGPYFQNGGFNLYKIADIFKDTIAVAKASHILIKWDDNTPEAKAKARNEAEKILNKLKAGANFAEAAKEYSQDGSAQNGGDLGWFSRDRMVKPFADAVFNATNKGLINHLVESQFGYHIIDVTEPKNYTAFKIARVERTVTPSDETRNLAFRKADFFAANSSDYETFKENAEKDSLQIFTAENIGPNDRRFNDVGNARLVVQWVYNDAEVGDVSPVKELEDQYIVAILTKITEPGVPDFEDVRDRLEPKVKNEKKGAIIVDKLKNLQGDLDEMATKYGTDAKVYSSNNLKLSSNTLPSVGFVPVAIGTSFALKDGERSKPVEEETGILVIQMVAKTKAPEIADYSTYKNQLEQKYASRTASNIPEAIKKWADIKDRRFRFF